MPLNHEQVVRLTASLYLAGDLVRDRLNPKCRGAGAKLAADEPGTIKGTARGAASAAGGARVAVQSNEHVRATGR